MNPKFHIFLHLFRDKAILIFCLAIKKKTALNLRCPSACPHQFLKPQLCTPWQMPAPLPCRPHAFQVPPSAGLFTKSNLLSMKVE